MTIAKSPKQLRGVCVAAVLAVLLAGCCRPVLADEMTPSAGDQARDLAAEVLRKSGSDDLADWTRSVIDRALERAGAAARQTVPGSSGGPAPLPGERHAGALADGTTGRESTADVLIFASLSVPAASWRQWAREAAKAGAPLVLRGVGEGGLRETVKRIGERLGGAEAGSLPRTRSGVAIDPRLFRLFGIERVPAVVAVPGGVPPCESRGCADDPAPPHDLVAGNIGLAAALEAVVGEGSVGRAVARRHLERMRGEDQP